MNVRRRLALGCRSMKFPAAVLPSAAHGHGLWPAGPRLRAPGGPAPTAQGQVAGPERCRVAAPPPGGPDPAAFASGARTPGVDRRLDRAPCLVMVLGQDAYRLQVSIGVLTEHHHQTGCIAKFVSQRGEGVDAVGGPRARQVSLVTHQGGLSFQGRAEQAHTNRRGAGRFTAVVRGCARHQVHPVEPQAFADFIGHAQVPEVDRVEGAAQKPDAQRAGASGGFVRHRAQCTFGWSGPPSQRGLARAACWSRCLFRRRDRTRTRLQTGLKR